MKNIYYLFLSLLTVACTTSSPTYSEADIALVPKPQEFQLDKASFKFDSTTTISIDNDEQQMAANYLTDLFKKAAGFDLNISKDNGIVKFQKIEGLQLEAYQLKVTPTEIIIKASDAAGYFYGVQTLRQLLPVEIENTTVTSIDWFVPSVTIKDAPRFAWRGMQMDFSRHFFSLDNVKTFLDYMALYKLNTYHMHLTDDQGWRVEIKKYPLLTEKGAWRIESSHDKYCNEMAKTDPSFIIDEQHYHDRDGQRMYGGFFTQEQIKEIIKYAAARNIEVIPEIDMPGHFKSAIDNYPYLSCTGEAGWGEHFSIPACLGKETSYEFAKDILSEIADLFPSEYIHIGGDEVNTKSWTACANCQKAIKKNNLKNEHELQSFFNKDIEKFLHTKGKRLIGWDEIVDGGLSNDATVMWWRNWAPKARYIAADNGSNMIICPDFEYYFDFTNEATPLDKVYNYEPVPEDFTKEQEKHVLGVQANLWAERIPNFKRLQYQAFPRLLALSETGWTSKEARNFDDFQERMALQYHRLDQLNIKYYIPSVKGTTDKIAFLETTTITLVSPLEDMEIYYTLDGTKPSKNSTKYTTPFIISENTTLKTIAYRGDVASEIKTSNVEKQLFIEPLNVQPTKGSLKQWSALKKFTVVEKVNLDEKSNFKLVGAIDLTGFENIEHVSLVFKGYFMAEEDGLFEFSTKSDDGSLLYINNKLVVDNGGNHAAVLRSGMVALKKGWHPITLTFHQGGGGSELSVKFKSPSNEEKVLTNEFLGY
ncbi:MULTISPECIES: family 20 glycosylhydrolase [Flavobacteriaceae]|uniref:beta-N-acetylhexosaminidase n=2 Tax=Flavobacteriaceae TaxID=49546 RepID=A0A4Y8AVG2_9FLAO|nr:MULTISPECIES: family 20 glycosylhydrolase [Flavobacteriaceae]TEW76536.1 beta-N-acetylhexosaminidase [Gramella jeungdoensis]GGK53792.1 beta-N-acetylhexosaminidase [Lutibacter litoralis]